MYTIAMIKSGAIRRGAVVPILSEIVKRKFIIKEIQEKQLCPSTVNALYAEHVGKPYYDGLFSSVTTTPVVIMRLTHPRTDEAAKLFREELGGTQSCLAAPGTLRNLFGGHITRGIDAPISDNAIHASDSSHRAVFEYSLLFT